MPSNKSDMELFRAAMEAGDLLSDFALMSLPTSAEDVAGWVACIALMQQRAAKVALRLASASDVPNFAFALTNLA